MDYTVVDIETTGLSRHYHRITEIAAVKVREGRIVDEFETLINPGVPIPYYITRLTGIDDRMVRHAPPIERILPHFRGFLEEDIFVAHNASFDWGFLDRYALACLDAPIMNERLCTRKLANRLLPDLAGKKLGLICSHLGIQNMQAHRAMGDVHATFSVFERFLGMLRSAGIVAPKDIIEFERSRRNDSWQKKDEGRCI